MSAREWLHPGMFAHVVGHVAQLHTAVRAVLASQDLVQTISLLVATFFYLEHLLLIKLCFLNLIAGAVPNFTNWFE